MAARTTRCEVLIVGGGPAGSTCAAQLVRDGLDVMVIDKSTFPRDKTCAGWITPQVVETLRLDLVDYASTRVLQPISGFATGIIGRDPRITRYDHAVSFGIRRCEFDHYLLERSGARLRLGEPVRSIERQGAGWRVNGNIEAAMIVGAGGHFCPVARLLGARVGRDEPAIAAQEAEFEVDPAFRGTDDAEPALYFCDDLRGYGWCFRKGRYLNVGLGREDNRGLARDVESFWAWLAARGSVPGGTPPKFKGHAYLLHGVGARRRIDNGVALIGDAAGIAYRQSGEGIRPAIESGVMAARVVAAAEGDYSRPRLQVYVAELERRLGTPGRAPGSPSLLPRRMRAALGRRVMMLPWFARRVLIERWFLHSHEPAMRTRSATLAVRTESIPSVS